MAPKKVLEQRLRPDLYPDKIAVGGEVELRDEAGDALTVANSLQRRAFTDVIEIHTAVLTPDSEPPTVRAEPAHRGHNM